MHTEKFQLWEAFLKELSDKIAIPTPNQPTVRCWTRTSLTKIINEIKKRTTLPTTFYNTPEILNHLINSGWAYRVEVDVPSDKTPPSKEFYLLDISPDYGAVDPLELLQAYKPDGIICYLSALTYHSLTTQSATYHHIALLSKPSKAYHQRRHKDNPQASVKKKSLGEMIFSYQDIPCYLIKRSPSVLVGVQTRILGPRTYIKITTFEQTLIDTIHKPLYCGGSPVVFEAWEDGVSRFDEELLNDYLIRINSHLISRRVGAMFDLLGYVPSDELKETLEKTSESDNQITNISLLPGLEFSYLNSKWGVMTP